MRKHKDGSLLVNTRKLLQRNKGNYLTIYLETGLSPNWLSQLATGKMRNPSVNRVQALYEHLAGKKLGV